MVFFLVGVHEYISFFNWVAFFILIGIYHFHVRLSATWATRIILPLIGKIPILSKNSLKPPSSSSIPEDQFHPLASNNSFNLHQIPKNPSNSA